MRYFLLVCLLCFLINIEGSVVKLPKQKKNVEIVNKKIKRISGKENKVVASAIVNNVDRKDWDTIIAICWVESMFNPKVISRTKDYGLMGINRPTWEKHYEKCFSKLLSPNENIRYGYNIYLMYKNRYKEKNLTLLMYNGGGKNYPQKIQNAIKIIKKT